MLKNLSILICCLFLSPILLAGQIYNYKLKNGLKLLVKIDRRAPVVVSQIWYKVGSSYEPLGITGISHALEHMMFQGTKKYAPGKLMQMVAANGGEQNAATSYDFTFYYQKLPAEKLALSFELEADRLSNLLLLNDRFAKEQQVIIEERRLRTDNNPQALTFERFFAAANIATGYHHPIIGWMNDIKQLNVKDLYRWHEQYYAPNNAALVVVGDVNPQKVFALVKKYFGNIRPKKKSVIKTQHNASPAGKRTVIVNAPAKVPLILLGYNVPAIKTAEKKWYPYALSNIAGILAAGNSSRLPKTLIRQQQIAAYASAQYDPFSRLSGIFMLAAIPMKNNSIATLQQALRAQIKTLRTTLVSNKELQKVKTQIIAQRIFAQDSMEEQAEEIGVLESVGLPLQVGENFAKEINKITPEQIQEAARKFLIEKRLTIAILKPQRNENET